MSRTAAPRGNQPEPNWKNRTLWTGRDNLEVMRGMNSRSVDLIYLDPPFNSNRTYSAPIGSQAAGASFRDSWTFDDVDRVWLALQRRDNPTLYHVVEAARLAHSAEMAAYIGMMAQRLCEMKRLLRAAGSVYLHCDDTAAHWLRALMDGIFGRSAFRNEVVWKRIFNHSDAGRFGRTNDRLLFYGSRINRDGPRVPLGKDYVAAKYRHEDERGWYQSVSLTGPGTTDGESGEPWKGWNPTDIGRHWSAPRTGDYAAWIERNVIPNYRAEPSVLARLELLDRAGLIVYTSKGAPRLKTYLKASKGQIPPDVWTDIPPVNSQAKERTNYPTQKPLALLRRVIAASSSEGDTVLDPFCGCATTCVAAEELGRQWVGIDISHKAAELVRMRLQQAVDDRAGIVPTLPAVIHRTDLLRRTDLGKLPRYTAHKDALYGQTDNGECGGCGHPFPKRNLTVDHVVPVSKGGTDHVDNLWLLCAACNSSKGTKSQAEFVAQRMGKHGSGMQWLDQ